MGTLNLAETVQQLKKILSSVTYHVNMKALPPVFKKVFLLQDQHQQQLD